MSGFVRAHWSVLGATRKTIGGHHSAPAYVVPPPCRNGSESVVFELLFLGKRRGIHAVIAKKSSVVRLLYVPRLGCHAQMTLRASTARGWPGRPARARVHAHAHVNADGHVARPPRTKRARWCGHAALLPDRCQRRPEAVNANASASASVPVGVARVRVGKFVVVVGREGTGERVRASASWSVVRLRLAWTLMLIGVEATRRARRLRAYCGDGYTRFRFGEAGARGMREGERNIEWGKGRVGWLVGWLVGKWEGRREGRVGTHLISAWRRCSFSVARWTARVYSVCVWSHVAYAARGDEKERGESGEMGGGARR